MREKLTPQNTSAVMIDMQQKLMPPMENRSGVTERTAYLLRCLAELGIPVIVTQQYTRGLGDTETALMEAAKAEAVFDKITYSCYQDDAIRDYWEKSGRKNILIWGVEAHICVQQTALDLVSEGYRVYVICDCTDSRNSYDREIAFRRMEQQGIVLTTSESVVYELLERAGTDLFRRISRLTKEAPLFREGAVHEG